MKKIAIISLGYMWFPCESGPSRFFQIAKTFVDAGYDVEVITTDFQHFKKEPRDKEKIMSQGYPFHITFIQTPPYKKNIDVRRVLSNRIAEKNLRKYLKRHVDEYAAVYTSIPANNIAAAVTEICYKRDIPCVVDIEDLWPEAMSMVIKNKTVCDIICKGFLRDAETAYRNCSGVIGTSDDYTNRAFKFQNRYIPHKTIYVGNDIKEFDAGVRENISGIEKEDADFWVTYAGSLGTSYDIPTLITAAGKIKEMGYSDISFHILGIGPRIDEFKELATKNDCNIRFYGYVQYKIMAAYLYKSDILVNSVVRSSSAGIINKIGDYLASGNPMINTESNREFRDKVDKDDFGINVWAEDVDELVDAILELYKDKDIRIRKGNNARRIAETEFDRAKTYPDIVKFIEQVM